jgi:hypothetical protein
MLGCDLGTTLGPAWQRRLRTLTCLALRVDIDVQCPEQVTGLMGGERSIRADRRHKAVLERAERVERVSTGSLPALAVRYGRPTAKCRS